MKYPFLKSLGLALILSAGWLFATAQTYQWNNVAMGGGGFVSAIITGKTERNLMYARTDVGGAYRWDSASVSWQPLLDWVSADQTGYLGVESLAIDPQAPNRLYMLVGISYFNGGKTAILSSSDNGKTFTVTDVTNQFKAHGNGMGRQNGERLQVDPNNSNILYCGTRQDGLFRSIDKGLHWQKLSSLDVSTTVNKNGISFVLIDPKSGTKGNASQIIYVGVSRASDKNLYVSTDGGKTFSGQIGTPTDFLPQKAALANDGYLYITYANGAGPSPVKNIEETMDNGAVWKLNTGSNEWTNITPKGFNRPFSGISIDPGNPKRIVVSTINTYIKQYTANGGKEVFGDRILISTNAGENWRDPIAEGMKLDENGVTWVNGTNMHWVGSVEFDPFNTKKIWLSSGQGIFSCADINANNPVFKFSSTGIEETVPMDLVSIPGGPLVSVIGDYDGFVHTNIKKYAPIHFPKMGSTNGIAYGGSNSKVLLRTGGRLYYSLDQGASWQQCISSAGTTGKIAVSADGNIFLHSPGRSKTTFRTTDNGRNWAACAGLDFSNTLPVADLVNKNLFYAYNTQNGSFFSSTDGGSQFSVTANIAAHGSRIIRAVPGKEGHIWAALNEAGLVCSYNGGKSFKEIKNVTNCAAVGFGKAARGNNYPAVFIWGVVNNSEGCFMSSDEGNSWVRINDKAHQYGGIGNGRFIMGDMNIYGRVYMSTAGRGIAYGEMVKQQGYIAAD